MSYEQMPAGWTTNTFWCHLAYNVLTSDTTLSGNPFHRKTVATHSLRKTQREGRHVNEPAMALSYAFHWLKQTGLLESVGRGVFRITAMGRAMSNHKDGVLWAVFAAHRKYAERYVVKTKNVNKETKPNSRVIIIQSLLEKLRQCERELRRLQTAV